MKISLVGDVALNGLFTHQPEKNIEKFQNVLDILHDSDVVFANLETPIEGKKGPNRFKLAHGGIINFTTESVLNEILPLLNISAVSLANNHIYDFGNNGISRTIQCLDKLMIKHTGAGINPEQVSPIFIEKDNIKIGFIAYVDKNTNPQIEPSAQIFINEFEENIIIQEIKKTKLGCNFLILSLHWGIDYSYYPTVYQRKVAKKFIDAGANIIMGHHPHTIQPFEKYGNGIIFYSLGSFCYGDFYKNTELRSLNLKTKNSIIATIDPLKYKLKIFTLKTVKYNYIYKTHKNIKYINKKRLLITKIIHNNKILYIIIFIKEMILDKSIDYFFGYYKNPIKQIIRLILFNKLINYYKDIRSKYINLM